MHDPCWVSVAPPPAGSLWLLPFLPLLGLCGSSPCWVSVAPPIPPTAGSLRHFPFLPLLGLCCSPLPHCWVFVAPHLPHCWVSVAPTSSGMSLLKDLCLWSEGRWDCLSKSEEIHAGCTETPFFPSANSNGITELIHPKPDGRRW